MKPEKQYTKPKGKTRKVGRPRLATKDVPQIFTIRVHPVAAEKFREISDKIGSQRKALEWLVTQYVA